MATRDQPQITGSDIEDVKRTLNFALARIYDRLDKIEGIRGGSSIESDLDMNDNTINNLASLATTTLDVSGTGTINKVRTADFALSDTGWEDITADLSAGKAVGANAPTWATFRNGIEAYSFSAGTMNEVWITFHVKHDYAPGTNIYPHIHWAPSTTSTGVVRWGLEYSWAKGHDQEAFPASTTIYLEHTISEDKQYQHIITEVTDAQAFGSDDIETDGLLLVRIFRDAADSADTFPDVVFGLTADIHFEVSQIATPNKAAPFF